MLAAVSSARPARPSTRQSPPWQLRQPASVDTGTATLVVATTWSRSSRASTVTTG